MNAGPVDDQTSGGTGSGPVAGYDFHDPGFVTWWLDSLYLLPQDDQLAIAQRLLSAVHSPGSRHEIEAFLELRGREPESTQTSPTRLAGPDGWRSAMRDVWRARPWLTAIGLLACAFFVFKGVWFLWRSAFSL